MDFLRSILGGESPSGNDDIEGVFTRSRKVFADAVEIIQKAAKHEYLSGKGKAEGVAAFNATLLIFLVVWQLVGWAAGGVNDAASKDKKSPLVRLWDIIRAAFETPDLHESIQKIRRVADGWKDDE